MCHNLRGCYKRSCNTLRERPVHHWIASQCCPIVTPDLGRDHANIQNSQGLRAYLKTGINLLQPRQWNPWYATTQYNMGLYLGLVAGRWAMSMAPYGPFHECNWKAFGTALPDWKISHRFFLIDAYWMMSLVNTRNFRTCNKLGTTCVSCNRLAHWVWLQVLYAVLTACKKFVLQLRTFLEESCVYQCKYLYLHIYTCTYTHLRNSLCVMLCLITSGGKALPNSSVAASS